MHLCWDRSEPVATARRISPDIMGAAVMKFRLQFKNLKHYIYTGTFNIVNSENHCFSVIFKHSEQILTVCTHTLYKKKP